MIIQKLKQFLFPFNYKKCIYCNNNLFKIKNKHYPVFTYMYYVCCDRCSSIQKYHKNDCLYTVNLETKDHNLILSLDDNKIHCLKITENEFGYRNAVGWYNNYSYNNNLKIEKMSIKEIKLYVKRYSLLL